MQATSVQLLHITDPHLHAHRDAMMRGINTFDTFSSIIKRVHAGERKPDAIIATGDLVQDETRQGYERFRDTIAGLGVPIHCIPGNHDSPRIMAETLDQPPFQYCGMADYAGWRLIMLNTAVRWEDTGRLEPEELARLEEALASGNEKHALICMHHHPVPMGSQWLDGINLRNADEFFAVTDRYRNVRGIVWGHVHQASDRERNGVALISTPSTGSQFLPFSEGFKMDQRPPGYRWLRLMQDGSIETELVWLK